MPTNMNRLFTILCMVSLLGFHTSCNNSATNSKSPNTETKTRVIDPKVQNLIQQARKGDIEAYNSLALCYRNGDGVEKSWLNMFCMYVIYYQKIGKDIEDITELFDEGHPSRLMCEIFNSPTYNDEVKAIVAQLKQVLPAEAKAIEAAQKAFSMTKGPASAMKIVREAEDEGSELAVIFQAIYYDRVGSQTEQEEFLTRTAEKYPVFNLLLGDIYAEKYDDSEDFSYISKAIEYYYKADAYGMLIPEFADKLWKIYDYFGHRGELEYDEQEAERLKILATRTYPTE